jgi:hypothetical protein
MAGHKTPIICLLYLLSIAIPSFALLEEKFVAFTSGNSSVSIHNAVIIHDGDDPAGVQIAARALAKDLEQITGSRPRNITWINDGSVVNGTDTNAIIFGTVDSGLISALVDDDKLAVSDVECKWETFQTTVVNDPFPGVKHALVIAGSDMRGTAFGVYTLAEQCGQSPFHFWADVPATKHEAIYALDKTTLHGEPTIKFRGLFINDEAPALTGSVAEFHKKLICPH